MHGQINFWSTAPEQSQDGGDTPEIDSLIFATSIATIAKFLKLKV